MPQIIQTGRCCAVRLPTLNYRRTRLQLQQTLGQQFGEVSRQFMDLMVAPLHCAGCLWEFPDSYRDSLFMGQMSESEFGFGDRAMPGYRQFAETGLCPMCSCSESVLLYEYFLPDAIDQADLHAIGKYWQEQARRWWRLAEEQQLSCSACSAPIFRNQGFLMNTMLLCKSCADRELAAALDRLRSYPHYLGNNLLRKVRRYRE